MNYAWIEKLLVCFTWFVQSISQVKRLWGSLWGRWDLSVHQGSVSELSSGAFPRAAAEEQRCPLWEQGWQEPAPPASPLLWEFRHQYSPEDFQIKALAQKLDPSFVLSFITRRFSTLPMAVEFSGSPSFLCHAPVFISLWLQHESAFGIGLCLFIPSTSLSVLFFFSPFFFMTLSSSPVSAHRQCKACRQEGWWDTDTCYTDMSRSKKKLQNLCTSTISTLCFRSNFALQPQ